MDNTLDLSLLAAVSSRVAPAHCSQDAQQRRSAVCREATAASSIRGSLTSHAGMPLATTMSLPRRRHEPLTASYLADLELLNQQATRPTTTGILGASYPLIDNRMSLIGGTSGLPSTSNVPLRHHLVESGISMPSADFPIPNSRRVLEEELILSEARRINAERRLISMRAEADFLRSIHSSLRSREACLPPRNHPSLSTYFPPQMRGDVPELENYRHSRALELRSNEEMALARLLASAGENDVSRPQGADLSTIEHPSFLLHRRDSDVKNRRSDTGVGTSDNVTEFHSNHDTASDAFASLAVELDASQNNIAPPEVLTLSQASDAEAKRDLKDELPATISLPSDDGILNEIHCFLRQDCMGLFFATEADVAAMGKGARPSKVNQVGLRCVHCAHVPRCNQAKQSICYPKKVQSIFESVRNFQRVHMASCPYLPDNIKARYQELLGRADDPHKTPQKLVKAYYARSAIELGLRDAPMGLEFVGRPKNSKPLSSLDISELIEPLEEESSSAKDKSIEMGKFEDIVTLDTRKLILEARKKSTPFVLPHDFPSVSDLTFLLFQQLLPYAPTPAIFKRRGLKYDPNHPTPGLCCKYCLCAREGENNSSNKGMYFPQTVGSMGDSSFSQTLLTHLAGCPNVPQPVKNALDELYCLAKANNVSEARGAKKKFMKKIWKRMMDYCEKKQEKLSTNISRPN